MSDTLKLTICPACAVCYIDQPPEDPGELCENCGDDHPVSGRFFPDHENHTVFSLDEEDLEDLLDALATVRANLDHLRRIPRWRARLDRWADLLDRLKEPTDG